MTTFYKTLAILSLLLSLANNTLYAHFTTEKLENNFFFTKNINIEPQPIDTPIFSIISPTQATVGEPFCVDLIAEGFDSLIGGSFFMCVDTAFIAFKNIEYLISDTWLTGETLLNDGAVLFNFLESDFFSGTSYPDSTILSTICFTPKKEGLSNVEFCKNDPRPGSDFPPDIISTKEGGTQLPFFGNDGQEITINESDNLPLSISSNEIKPTCNNAFNGGFSFQVDGGTLPYQTIVRNLDNDDIINDTISSANGSISITDLAPGNYSFEVTDSGINQKTSGPQGPILIEVSNLVITNGLIVPPSCFGDSNGQLTAQVAINGLPQSELSNFSFFWLNQSRDTVSINSVASNLGTGEYQVKVEDSDGCSAEKSFILTEPSLIETFMTTQMPNCPDADGTITINEITGGFPPYTIEWSNGGTTLANLGLMDGNYNFTITDENGCTYSEFIDLKCSMSTSLEELEEQRRVLIYPNPTINELGIQFVETLKITSNIKLFTLTGQLLQNWTIRKGINRKKINLENQTTGIYLIEIEMGGAVYREKIIKL